MISGILQKDKKNESETSPQIFSNGDFKKI